VRARTDTISFVAPCSCSARTSRKSRLPLRTTCVPPPRVASSLCPWSGVRGVVVPVQRSRPNTPRYVTTHPKPEGVGGCGCSNRRGRTLRRWMLTVPCLPSPRYVSLGTIVCLQVLPSGSMSEAAGSQRSPKHRFRRAKRVARLETRLLQGATLLTRSRPQSNTFTFNTAPLSEMQRWWEMDAAGAFHAHAACAVGPAPGHRLRRAG
jgi:hypothetical protein